MFWVLHIYVYLRTLEDELIPYEFNPVFLIYYALLKVLMLVFHKHVLPFLILGKLEDARIPFALNSVVHFRIRFLV